MSSDSPSAEEQKVSIGRIPLKQVRVKRGEIEAKDEPARAANPVNRLVPYLDLFGRLDDEELSRLAGVEVEVAEALRKQVLAIDRALCSYADLLPRLSDHELVRLTGATLKTIRFWRLCQPRDATLHASRRPQETVSRSAAAKAGTAHTLAELAGEGGPVRPREEAAGLEARRRDPSESSDVRRREELTRQVREGGESSQVRRLDVPDVPRGPQPQPVDIEPAESQHAVQRYMMFSGDPFPGFDYDGPELPDDAITLESLGDDSV